MKKIVAVTLIAMAFVAVPMPASAVEPISEKPAYARWATPIVKVYVDPSTQAQGWNIDRALKAWELGPLDLKTVSTPCTGCITITPAPGGQDWWGVARWQRIDGTMTHCDIELAVDTGLQRRPYIAAHELGHCLGLPHINDKHSVMDFWGRIFHIDPAPTSADLAWLTAAYMPQA